MPLIVHLGSRMKTGHPENRPTGPMAPRRVGLHVELRCDARESRDKRYLGGDRRFLRGRAALQEGAPRSGGVRHFRRAGVLCNTGHPRTPGPSQTPAPPTAPGDPGHQAPPDTSAPTTPPLPRRRAPHTPDARRHRALPRRRVLHSPAQPCRARVLHSPSGASRPRHARPKETAGRCHPPQEKPPGGAGATVRAGRSARV
jgi:hypothetical protein